MPKYFATSRPEQTFANVMRLICKHFYVKYCTQDDILVITQVRYERTWDITGLLPK